jgi:hypothetical protein
MGLSSLNFAFEYMNKFAGLLGLHSRFYYKDDNIERKVVY